MERVNDTEEITRFLARRGYGDDVVKNVKDTRVTSDSIHLFTIEDFNNMGVALADARLLIEMFQPMSKLELKNVAETIKKKRLTTTTTTTRKSSSICIQFSWQHFIKKKDKYVTIRQSEGGGMRQCQFLKQSTFAVVFEKAKDVFFPHGRNLHYGFFSSMDSHICGPDDMIISLSCKIDDYIQTNSLKYCKVIFKTKEKRFKDILHEYAMARKDDNDDENDMNLELPAFNTNQINHPVCNLLDTNYDTSGSAFQFSSTPTFHSENFQLSANINKDLFTPQESSLIILNNSLAAAQAGSSNLSDCPPEENEALEEQMTAYCPICSLPKSTSEIEAHAAECADRKFANDFADEKPPGLYQRTVSQKDVTESLQKKIEAINTNVTNNKCTFTLKIRPKHCFEDFCQKFKQPWIKKKIGSPIVIEFIGESGIDQGGLKREFFSDALDDAVSSLLEDSCYGEKEPRTNSYGDMAENKFFLFGQLMASSIIFSGPAPNFFSTWVYEYMVNGLEGVFAYVKTIPESSQLSDVYQKFQSASTEQEIRDLAVSESGLDLLTNIGYRGVPSRITLKEKKNILRSIIMRENIQNKLPIVDQIINGLRLYGLFDTIKENVEEFRYIFCPNELFNWTYDKFEEFVVPIFSDDGSNKKVVEVDVFKSFMDCVELFFYSEQPEVSLGDLMKFLSGSPSIPPLGWKKKLSINFKHWCSSLPNPCKCKPSVSTCALCLTIPIHYRRSDDMKSALVDAVKMSQGFDC